ncbi:flagellar type III secretion system protein FlhB [Xylophilus rhododendri]|uniref:Flagellar type III secretion system protein FlhB n=1 Tax=Xylophilus rhododendri TaxID=2697032 RepID=A0A857J8S2_9BURK|nr:EscU/YscU/HrcU family type III secretion system export apparatus switch protein [Xylophilus rhododendri]QHI99175.1 flagellar type III secretion system protein FlhB [Xylophilus rhododendri]
MSQSDLDRSQPATAHKLQRAREQGQVARSPHLSAALVFAVAMAFMAWRGLDDWQSVFQLCGRLLSRPGTLDGIELAGLASQGLKAALLQSAPFLGAIAIAAVLGNVLQFGWVLSFEALSPRFERLDPAAGFKRLFSTHTLFQLLRSLLKLAILVVVTWMALQALLPQFFGLATLSAQGWLQAIVEDLSSLGLKLAATLGLVALLDYAYTRRSFQQRMRMSRRELRDEHKSRDGDPRIRARIRKLMRESLKRSRSVRRTGEADVLIANPTHLCVALRYVHGEMAAPQLIAKGQGLLAAAMRKIAARHAIPVVHSPALARALFRELPVDGHVPPHLYGPVARIVVWVLARRRDAAAAASGAVPS